MSSDSEYPSSGKEAISIDHGFAALRHFLNAFWERDGKPYDSMVKLLSWIEPGIWADGSPLDPAMWEDWLKAIEATRSPT
ncbi:MAG: hypothetical protein B7Z38_02050 [Rhodobacterales bacterium 12-64-8]|nr:MAG: hypothetical protein B7Z38_02050 [Rhodobacterales bacterium 12-64-8]OYX51308.1 MAG: hypothetical protein B7Y90_01395 [Alphaproteobacteria bacterium 32-64-14]